MIKNSLRMRTDGKIVSTGVFPTGAATSGQLIVAADSEDSAWANPTFPDNTFRIYDNTDNTKILAFDASTIPTATTQTLPLYYSTEAVEMTISTSPVGATTWTVTFLRCGNRVYASWPLKTGTATGAATIGWLGQIPAVYRPASNFEMAVNCTSNSTGAYGVLSVTTAGTGGIGLTVSGAGNFAGTGTYAAGKWTTMWFA